MFYELPNVPLAFGKLVLVRGIDDIDEAVGNIDHVPEGVPAPVVAANVHQRHVAIVVEDFRVSFRVPGLIGGSMVLPDVHANAAFSGLLESDKPDLEPFAYEPSPHSPRLDGVHHFII